jgi:hypothetical protein
MELEGVEDPHYLAANEYGEDASAMEMLTKKVKQARAYIMVHQHTHKM